MSPYIKTLIRTIKGSLARFLAIFAIIALGVGFYGGLLLTQPSFIKTGDKFIREQKLYDFRLISTIGFTDEDIDKLASLDGVKVAQGAVWADVMVDDFYKDSTRVARFHTITDGVNVCTLESGRMPQAPNEAVVDGYVYSDDVIGKTITLSSDNTQSALDTFTYDEYTVVGTVRSPYYLNFQRGSSSVGNGQVGYYVYVPLDGMDHEYYSEAFLFYDTDYYLYSDEYDEWAEKKQEELEDQVQAIEEARFAELMADAKEELDDGYETFCTERDDAWAEIVDARQKLIDAKGELKDASDKLVDAEKEIQDGKKELDDGQKEIDDNMAKLKQSEAELEEGQLKLDAARQEATMARKTLQAQLDDLKVTMAGLEKNLAEINAAIEAIEEAERLGYPTDTFPVSKETLLAQKAQVEAGLAQGQAGLAALEAGLAQVDAGLVEIEAQQKIIDDGRAQIKDGYAQLKDAQGKVDSGRRELSDGETEYNDGLIEYNDGLKEYEDGLIEFRDGMIEYQNQMAFAGRILGEGMMRFDIAKTTEVSTYVLGRDTNVGYVCFKSDSEIVAGVARVFPLFFFALAALVCSTTMQRMIGDERGQIGTMRALGYSEFAVIMKYVVYSGLASVIGCILGFMGGIKLFPYVIWQVYGMMYGFSDVFFANDWLIFSISLVVSLICSVGVTVYTCMSEMRGTPAELIRPKAPAAGKKILLERIGFLWKPLKFTYKVSIRNIFRFKKRMFMMIIGIAGCTALLVTGFGLRDSVGDVVNVHYGTVLTYDISVTFNDDVSEKNMLKLSKKCDEKTGVATTPVLVRCENLTHNGEMIRDVNLIVSDDPNIKMACGSWVDGENLPWPGDGEIAISNKLANMNNLSAGDEITFSYGDSGENFTLKISYVFDNYIYHYAYMNVTTYEMVFDKAYAPNTMYVVMDENSEVSSYDYAQNFASDSQVKTWTVVDDMRANFRETMNQMDKVVILIIGCAAALAFIVLFNLNNINITERVREIATLKVLGFNRRETGSYVFRENFILVFFGFIVGIPLGVMLCTFVVSQITMDMVSFIIKITPLGCLYSLGFVILFSVIVDLLMRRKIEKIDMAESLKSIE
ncbi:MAG: FtsX-like permease family protein [Saccharofermentans sp.]|nr:FtsX-like permease family protein [Saccharofermentans sp.]